MKLAQDVRAGNVIMINDVPMVVTKAEYNKSGRNAAVMKMKLRNLLQGTTTEGIYKADEKFEDLILDRKEMTYSYYADPNYVFMDEEFNQYEIPPDDMGDAAHYIEDGLKCEIVFYNEKPISIDLPTKVVRAVTSTDPVVRGDTTGRVLKPAKIGTGFEVQVPAFIVEGDMIEIDTRTGEYSGRISK